MLTYSRDNNQTDTTMRKIRKGLYTDKNENLRVEKVNSGWSFRMFDINDELISGIAPTKDSAIAKAHELNNMEIRKLELELGIL